MEQVTEALLDNRNAVFAGIGVVLCPLQVPDIRSHQFASPLIADIFAPGGLFPKIKKLSQVIPSSVQIGSKYKFINMQSIDVQGLLANRLLTGRKTNTVDGEQPMTIDRESRGYLSHNLFCAGSCKLNDWQCEQFNILKLAN